MQIDSSNCILKEKKLNSIRQNRKSKIEIQMQIVFRCCFAINQLGAASASDSVSLSWSLGTTLRKINPFVYAYLLTTRKKTLQLEISQACIYLTEIYFLKHLAFMTILNFIKNLFY